MGEQSKKEKKAKKIKRIIVQCEDGTEEILQKGLIISVEKDGKSAAASMAVCNLNLKEIMVHIEASIVAFLHLTD